MCVTCKRQKRMNSFIAFYLLFTDPDLNLMPVDFMDKNSLICYSFCIKVFCTEV